MTINVLGGRRWRDEADPAFGRGSNLDGTVSDWVGGVSADFGRKLRLETRARFDNDDFGLSRIDAGAKTALGRLSGSVRYFKLDSDLSSLGTPEEGVAFNAKVRLTENYFVQLGQTTDLIEQRDLRQSIGISYEDDCSVFQIMFTRSETIDRTLGQNDSIMFAFSLKSLGTFGSSDF